MLVLNFYILGFGFVSDFELRISSLCFLNSTNSFVRIYKQIMQNEPNFPQFSPENACLTKKQTQFEPNSKPNKPNFGSKTQVAKPNEANFQMPENRSYCVDQEPYNAINNAARGIYHSKECRFMYQLFHLFFIIADMCLEFDKEFFI